MNNSTFSKVLGKGGKFYDEVSSPETFGNIENIKAIAVVDGKPSTTTDYETFTPIVSNQLEQDVETLKTNVDTLNADVEELGNELNQTSSDLTNEITSREQADTALQSDINTRAKLDASNLTDENVASFVDKLAYNSESEERLNAVGFAEEERQKSKNLIELKNNYTDTNAGITVTINNDLIEVNGTSTATNSVYNIQNKNIVFEKGKTYTFSMKNLTNSGNSFSVIIAVKKSNGETIRNYFSISPDIMVVTKKIEETVTISQFDVFFLNGRTLNATFNLQLEEGSVATDYQPYNGAIVHEKLFSQGTLTTPTEGSTLNGVAHVVESYLSSDGLTWYRKWSDGWKECGIKHTSGRLSSVTLPISFSNINYTVNINENIASTSSGTITAGVSFMPFNSTVNSFKVQTAFGESGNRQYIDRPVTIYCCGY